jgi:uncharacterized membrane protein YdfJ with MMPL/SSD domain
MSRNSSANYGIQGNVNATAVAVGPHAKAVVQEQAPASRKDFDAALASIREQIAKLEIPKEKQEAVHKDLKQLESMAGSKPAARQGAESKGGAEVVLARVVKTLKLAGVAVQTIAGFQQPLSLLAAWFHIPPLF